MTNQRTLIEFRGTLTFEVIGQLLNELKKKMDELGETVNTYKRILIIMVETLENICKYAEDEANNDIVAHNFPTVFALNQEEKNYYISAGNLIKLTDQANIEERITKVNRLNPIELKKLYRQIIANGDFSVEGGAGLGFIEIAKSSGNKINYHFLPVDETKAFFTINLEITELENGEIRNKRN